MNSARDIVSPSRKDAQQHGARRHRLLTYARRFVIVLLLCCPMVIIGSLGFPLLLLIPIVIGIVFSVASRRRINQGKVLWTLALGVRSGSDLIQDLESIADGLSIGHRRKVLKLADRLFSGCQLDEALQLTPGVVPNDAVLAVRAGTKNGTLAESLRDAAVRHNQKYGQGPGAAFSPSLAVLYVVAVPLIGVIIVSGIMIYIIPKFKEIFEGFDTDLPGLTVRLIDLSDWSAKYWYLLTGPLFVLGFLAMILLAVAYIVGFGEFDIPLFGRRLQRLDLPNLLRIFASSIRQKQPLDETVSVVSGTHKRSAVRRSMDEVYHLIQAGEDPWQSMRSQRLLTDNEAAALQSAQRVDNLPWALEQVAESLERRFSYRWRTWLEFLQPGIVIAVGIAVGFIVVSLFLPLVKLLNDLA